MKKMIKKILLLGGESSGKTTLANALTKKLVGKLVEEYGRTYGETNPYTFDSMVQIADTHMVNISDAYLSLWDTDWCIDDQQKYLIIDTDILVTYYYSLVWYGRVDERLVNDLHDEYSNYQEFDDVEIFLLENDFDFVQDGSRQGIEFAKSQHWFYRGFLTAKSMKFTIIGGSVEERVEQVLSVVV